MERQADRAARLPPSRLIRTAGHPEVLHLRAAIRATAGRSPEPQPAHRDESVSEPGWPASTDPGLDSAEAYLSRIGDMIDDRVAELLDELLDERTAAHRRRYLPQLAAVVSLALAVAASVLMRHSPVAVWTIWPCAAVICLATSLSGRPQQL